MENEKLLSLINDYLSTITAGRAPQGLYEPIRYVLSIGGKRIRPMLMMLAYGMYDDDLESILPQACGLETYHNYTLLHDDLMDNASMRRGYATVHVKWDANTAILSGDSMLVMAYRLMLGGGLIERRHSDVPVLFTETALEIGEGQQMDVDFERRNDVTEDEYMEMIRLKTAVLLACALKTGALLADAPTADAEALYAYGEKIGLAFQLQDDYLDVYGDPAVFGKNIGGDILSNKKTYMLINALNRSEGAVRRELDAWLSATDYNPAEKIAAVTDIYTRLGIDRLAIGKIDSLFEEGKRCLDGLSVDEKSRRQLSDYVNAMMRRNR